MVININLISQNIDRFIMNYKDEKNLKNEIKSGIIEIKNELGEIRTQIFVYNKTNKQTGIMINNINLLISNFKSISNLTGLELNKQFEDIINLKKYIFENLSNFIFENIKIEKTIHWRFFELEEQYGPCELKEKYKDYFNRLKSSILRIVNEIRNLEKKKISFQIEKMKKSGQFQL